MPKHTLFLFAHAISGYDPTADNNRILSILSNPNMNNFLASKNINVEILQYTNENKLKIANYMKHLGFDKIIIPSLHFQSADQSSKILTTVDEICALYQRSYDKHMSSTQVPQSSAPVRYTAEEEVDPDKIKDDIMARAEKMESRRSVPQEHNPKKESHGSKSKSVAPSGPIGPNSLKITGNVKMSTAWEGRDPEMERHIIGLVSETELY